MDEFFERKISLGLFPAILTVTAVIAFIFYGAYHYNSLKKDLVNKTNQFEITSRNLESSIDKLKNNLASTTIENKDLNDILIVLRTKNTDFQNEIEEKNIKVATLLKLENTDPELLQKYSKIYFLNENYIPAELSLIGDDFIFNKAKPILIHAKVKPFLETLMHAARADGIDVYVLSGYRSFGAQASLKSQYSVIYGSGANKFSADQGYSEHQLGTTVDFTTKKNGEVLAGFDKTSTYKWLLNNAYRYGFILSYPANNKYYIFEPWHWRFAGVGLATDLHNAGKNFYDLSKREIDAYLIKLFD